MTTTLKARVSGFHFVRGISHEGAPHSLVVQKGATIPSAAKSTKGNFYVLVEIMGNPPGAEELSGKLAGLIHKTYANTHGTTTTSLRAAIRVANQFLLNENLRAPYEAQRDGSVCCLVLRGEDAYIARSGPVAAYHIRGARWDRFPPADPTATSTAPVPLGLRKEPDIAFHHIELAGGDLLMLMESRGDRALPRAGFDGPPQAAATAALRSAGQQTDFSTLLIEIDDERSGAKPFYVPGAKPSEPAATTRPPRRARRRRERDEPAPSADADVEAPPRPSRRKADEPADEAGVRPPRFSRLALILALITPLLVVGSFLGYNWYQQQQTDKMFEAALTRARESFTTARTTSDEAIAGTALAEAQGHLAGAAEIHPEDERVLQLKRDVTSLDDELRLVLPLYFVPELYRFVDANSEPGRIVINDSDIYVLDRRNSVITRHVMNDVADGLERGQEIIRVVGKGQQVGNIVVGNIVDMAWVPAGGEREEDGLLILDASGNLIAYNAMDGLSASALPGSEQLKRPLLIDGYSGSRLYILDAGNNQIYRYAPTAEGYTLPPETYFPDDVQVNLNGVRDMSIDGDVWLLFLDHIDRYQAGRPVTYLIQGLDQPFSSPAGLYASPESSSVPAAGLYVADTGNDRVVKLTKNGQFIRQYRPRHGNQFTELRDLQVDTASSKIYFIAGSALYMADIPLIE